MTQKYFLTCMMHDITYTRALTNATVCLMHDITCTRTIPNDITCIMYDKA